MLRGAISRLRYKMDHFLVAKREIARLRNFKKVKVAVKQRVKLRVV